jgi:hypothetical protein
MISDISSDRSRSMAHAVEIGPLAVETERSQVCFRFANPHAMTLEVPDSLEEELSAYLDHDRAGLTGKRFVIDLQDLPALNSRQLGMMLTIRKVCSPIGSVWLDHVSDGVKYLLSLTRTAGWFDLVPVPGSA